MKLFVGLSLLITLAALAVWSLRGDRTEPLLSAARQARARGEFREAQQLAGQALDVSPRSIDALKLRAEASEKLGDWETAAADYERLAPLESQRDAAAQAWQDAGRAWMGAMRARQAERRLLESARLAPHRPEPFRLLAQLYSIEGRSDELIQQLMRLVELGNYTLDDLIVLGRQDPFIDDPERRAALPRRRPDRRWTSGLRRPHQPGIRIRGSLRKPRQWHVRSAPHL